MSISSTFSSTPPTVSDAALATYKEEIISLASLVLPSDPNDIAGQRPSMAHVHWMFLNALETIWEKADQCAGDEVNFVAYALLVTHELEQHHHGEETIYFPFLISKGVQGLDHNVEEHQAMHAQLEDLITYLRDLSQDPSAALTFSADKLRSLMQSLFVELVPHLRHELDTIAPEKLEGHMGVEEMKEMNKVVEKMLSGYDPKVFLPLFVVNVQPGVNFPPFPFVVRKVLIPLMFKRKHSALWKYGKYPREVDLW